jgi:thiol-disulfide isomerase/thioredoxin
MKKFIQLFSVVALLVLVGAGCVADQQATKTSDGQVASGQMAGEDAMMDGDDSMVKDDGEMMEKDDDAMMGDDEMMKKDDSAMMEDKEGMMEEGLDSAMGEDSIMEDDDTMMEKEDSMMEDNGKMMEDKKETLSFSGAVLAGSSAPVLDFNQADYEKAKNSDKLIVVYFYANWCPVCKKEVANGFYPAFNGLSSDNVVAFRVNYKDNETDSAEEALAREFGVAYQHTKVFVKNGERVLKSPDSWSEDDYIKNISKFVN